MNTTSVTGEMLARIPSARMGRIRPIGALLLLPSGRTTV
jgi:hypothetical protein